MYVCTSTPAKEKAKVYWMRSILLLRFPSATAIHCIFTSWTLENCCHFSRRPFSHYCLIITAFVVINMHAEKFNARIRAASIFVFFFLVSVLLISGVKLWHLLAAALRCDPHSLRSMSFSELSWKGFGMIFWLLAIIKAKQTFCSCFLKLFLLLLLWKKYHVHFLSTFDCHMTNSDLTFLPRIRATSNTLIALVFYVQINAYLGV